MEEDEFLTKQEKKIVEDATKELAENAAESIEQMQKKKKEGE